VRGGDPVINQAGALAALVIGVTAIALFYLAPLRNLSAKPSSHEGCVLAFRQEIHPNEHNIVDTYFSVGGHAFHFNSSPWLSPPPGLDTIKPGEGLRITTRGDTVLRIEEAPALCPQPHSRNPRT
jgi:hypothetical protein